MPLFSIIIPTKNRASLVAEAVKHTLALPWDDFELLIIDNDDTTATTEALSVFKDPRLRIFRTGGLSMIDNWEAGLNAAKGDYFFQIKDKIRLKPNALSLFAERIKLYHPEVLACDGLPNWKTKKEDFKYDDTQWGILPSKDIIKVILDSDIRAIARYVPMGFSTCYAKGLVRSIQKKYGRMVYPVAADFTMGVATLFNTENLHHYYESLVDVLPGASAGWSSYYGGKLSLKCVAEMGLSQSDCIANAKIKFNSSGNTLYSDFIRLSKHMNKHYTVDDVDDVKHIIYIFEDIMWSKCRFHLDISEQLKMIYQYIEDKGLFSHPKIQEMFDSYDLKKVQPDKSMQGTFILGLIQNMWDSLGIKKCRVAIFGAGKHTQWMERAVRRVDGPEVVAVLDDRGKEAPECFGITATLPEKFNPSDVDAIIISSDEPLTIYKMRSRCIDIYGNNVKIIMPYFGFPIGPYAKIEPE